VFYGIEKNYSQLCNPHQELKGKTPAEIVEINLELGRNKLMELIEFVAKT